MSLTTHLPFPNAIYPQCFSSVVGPNGSGKSNVIDAMLFVFGYRAKKIRQAKLKDLIHKSENHRDLDYCRVTVFFQEIIDRVRRHREEREGGGAIPVLFLARRNVCAPRK